MKQILYFFFLIFSLAFLFFSAWVFDSDKSITIDLFIFSFDVKIKFLYLIFFILSCFTLREIENRHIRK